VSVVLTSEILICAVAMLGEGVGGTARSCSSVARPACRDRVVFRDVAEEDEHGEEDAHDHVHQSHAERAAGELQRLACSFSQATTPSLSVSASVMTSGITSSPYPPSHVRVD